MNFLGLKYIVILAILTAAMGGDAKELIPLDPHSKDAKFLAQLAFNIAPGNELVEVVRVREAYAVKTDPGHFLFKVDTKKTFPGGPKARYRVRLAVKPELIKE